MAFYVAFDWHGGGLALCALRSAAPGRRPAAWRVKPEPLGSQFLQELSLKALLASRRAATVPKHAFPTAPKIACKMACKIGGQKSARKCQNGAQNRTKMAPKSLKWRPGALPEATFCKKVEPSRNMRRHERIACAPPPASSIFAPFGPKSRPKALPGRRRKNGSKKVAKKSEKDPKMTPKWGE